MMIPPEVFVRPLVALRVVELLLAPARVMVPLLEKEPEVVNVTVSATAKLAWLSSGAAIAELLATVRAPELVRLLAPLMVVLDSVRVRLAPTASGALRVALTLARLSVPLPVTLEPLATVRLPEPLMVVDVPLARS